MSNPILTDMTNVIEKTADIMDGRVDGQYTQENFTRLINDIDRYDGVNDQGKGDGVLTTQGLYATLDILTGHIHESDDLMIRAAELAYTQPAITYYMDMRYFAPALEASAVYRTEPFASVTEADVRAQALQN